jgi:hypothetical protein
MQRVWAAVWGARHQSAKPSPLGAGELGIWEQGLAQRGADLPIGLQVVDVALGNASVLMGINVLMSSAWLLSR